MKLGYARVSTGSQSLEIQREKLEAAGCQKVFSEKASGKDAKDRPQFNELLEYAREGDEIVCCKVDRWARSISDLNKSLQKLASKGVKVTFLENPEMNLDTAHGELLLNILSSVSVFERRLILSRTAEGLARAKKAGVKFGPPTKVTPEIERKVRQMKANGGLSAAEIGKAVGLSRRTIFRILKNT